MAYPKRNERHSAMTELPNEKVQELRALAARARRLAASITDVQTIVNLRSYADQLEADAQRLERADVLPPAALPDAKDGDIT